MINPYLDTLIGVIVIVFIFSVFAYVLQEFLASLRESRGRMLRKAIYDLLNDNLNKGYGVLLFDHPQFNFLKKTDNRLPSYLPASNFANALIDLIGREPYDLHFPPPQEKLQLPETAAIAQEQDTPQTVVKLYADQTTDMQSTRSPESGIKQPEIDLRGFMPDGNKTFEMFQAGLMQMRTSNLKILLQNILANSYNLETLRANLENWYNDYMDRVTGWYKSKVRKNLIWIGIGLAVIFNVNTFYIIPTVYYDRQMRDKLVSLGQNIVDNPKSVKEMYSTSLNAELANIDKQCIQQMNGVSDSSKLIIQQNCVNRKMAVADSFTNVRLMQARSITDSLKTWDLPIGWKLFNGNMNQAGASGAGIRFSGRHWFWYHLIGWLLSGLAISAGAPFWFDVLGKLFNVRRAGIKPSTTSLKEKTQVTVINSK